MDQYATVLLSFPPDTTPHDDIHLYDKAAKHHLNQLSQILKENSADLIKDGPRFLDVRYTTLYPPSL